MAKTRFQRGSGCYPCGVCKRQTRDTGDNGGVELCPQCYELAGIENAISDAPDSWPENRDEEKRAVVARYESEINDHLSALKRNGVNVERVWDSLLKAMAAAKEPAGMDDGTQNPENGVAPETAEPVAPSKKLLQPDLIGERAMKLTEYRNLLGRMVIESTRAANRAQNEERIYTHDGINLSRLAVDIAALAAVIESLDRCITSCA